MLACPPIVVWPHRHLVGFTGDWAQVPSLVSCPVVPADVALATAYPTDAHFWPGWLEVNGVAEPTAVRLTRDSLPALTARGAAVRFGLLVVDVDDPDAHTGGGTASEPWRVATLGTLNALPEAWRAGLLHYTTRGGMRLLWPLREPLAPADYVTRGARARAALRAFGVGRVDELSDWTRCYRLPCVVRDGAVQSAPVVGAWGGRPPPDVEPPPAPRTMTLWGAAAAAKPPLVVPDALDDMRNDTLIRLAGRLRGSGLSEDEVLASLRGVNAARCKPPLPDAEVVHMAKSAGKWAAAPAPATAAPTPIATPAAAQPPLPGADLPEPIFQLGSDVELAREAGARLGAGLLVSDRGALWRYDTPKGVWEVIPEATVRNLVASWDGCWVNTGKQGKVKPLSVSHALTGNVYARLLVSVDKPGFFDAGVPGVAFRNGFVGLVAEDTVALVPHAAERRACLGWDSDFTPGQRPERLIAWLHSLFEHDATCQEKVQLIREWFGACFLGLATRFQRALVFYGPRASNGKSEVLRVFEGLFPPGVVSHVPPELFEDAVARVDLARARLNCVGELDEAEILQSAAFKGVVDGSTALRACGKYAHAFDFLPRAGNVFSTNLLPNVRDKSAGFWRRWIVVLFDKVIDHTEAVRDLAKQILAAERDAIVSWLIEGAMAAVARGHFIIPADCRRELDAWRYASDPVLQFLHECTTVCDPLDTGTRSRVLYHAWVAWAQRNHPRASTMTETSFGLRLRMLDVVKDRSNGSVYRVTLVGASVSFVQ